MAPRMLAEKITAMTAKQSAISSFDKGPSSAVCLFMLYPKRSPVEPGQEEVSVSAVFGVGYRLRHGVTHVYRA